MRRFTALLIILLLAALIATPVVLADKTQENSSLNVRENTLVNDLWFGDCLLAGMDVAEAKEAVLVPLRNMMTATYRIEAPSDPTEYFEATAASLGLYYDETAVKTALNAGMQKGTLLSRYKKAKDYQKNPVTLDAKISYDRSRIETLLAPYAEEWEQLPKDVEISTRRSDDYSVQIISHSQDGTAYDFTKGIDRLIEDIENGRILSGELYEIEVEETVAKPGLSDEDVKDFTIIGSFTTAYGKPDEDDEIRMNRQENLLMSTGYSNGKYFAPGEEIEIFRDLYGDITKERGYKKAGAYSEGSHVLNIGGGICQATTTLYNACLFAELEIVERHHHSMLVTYVEASRDAMVNWDEYQNKAEYVFRFKNNTPGYIWIEAYLTYPKTGEDNYITFNILGIEEHSPDRVVEYETVIKTWTAPKITVKTMDMVSLEELNGTSDETDPGEETEPADKETGSEDDEDEEGPDLSRLYPIGWSSFMKASLESDNGPTAGIVSELYKVVTENGVTSKPERLEIYSRYGTDRYSAQNATYYCSKDITLVAEEGESYAYGYVKVNSQFLNGITLEENPSTWTPEEREAFNEEMAELMEPLGYTWPDEGSGITVFGYDSFAEKYRYITLVYPDAPAEPDPEEETAAETE